MLDLPSRLAATILPRVWSRIPHAGRTLYLTFDDGPSEATRGLLDVLARYGAQASFFVLGERVDEHTDLLHRMRAEGHAVGSHGWEHSDPWNTARPNRWRLADDAVADALGEAPRWMRPPYGHLTYGTWRHAHLYDRHIALWDVMPGDFRASATPRTITERVLKNVRPGSIIVLHDGPAMHGRAEAMAETLVPALLVEGWALRALPDQPGSPGGNG